MKGWCHPLTRVKFNFDQTPDNSPCTILLQTVSTHDNYPLRQVPHHKILKCPGQEMAQGNCPGWELWGWKSSQEGVVQGTCGGTTVYTWVLLPVESYFSLVTWHGFSHSSVNILKCTRVVVVLVSVNFSFSNILGDVFL